MSSWSPRTPGGNDEDHVAGRCIRGGAGLRRERERVGLSLSELAKRAGIAKSTLSQLESASGNPSVETLWALGVGAVISGHYSGWNLGLAGGFGGMLVAVLIISLMYWGLCFSLAELSPAMPHTGGAYSFARSAMGPWGGMITGLAESIEYILTPAVIVFFIGSYMTAIFETPTSAQPIWRPNAKMIV